MRRRYQRKKGDSLVEYSLLWFIIVTALVAMSFYLRNAFCGGWREAANTFGMGRQYDPAGM